MYNFLNTFFCENGAIVVVVIDIVALVSRTNLNVLSLKVWLKFELLEFFGICPHLDFDEKKQLSQCQL